jgi:hypothetical protein
MTIFELKDTTSDFIYMIKKYLEQIGFKLNISYVNYNSNDWDELKKSDDYYCEIIDKIPDFMDTSPNKWVVGKNYQLRQNNFFQYNTKKSLDQYKAIFRTVDICDNIKSFKLFTVSFDFKI